MTDALQTGAIKFVVRYGGQPVVGAKVYTSSNRMTWYYRGYTNTVGILITMGIPTGLNYYMVGATGFNTVNGTVNVILNSMVEVDVYMTRSLSVVSMDMMGSLTITSTPEGAWVYINGAVQERPTPVTVANLPEGEYLIELATEGYYGATLARVVRGQTATTTASLSPS